MQGCFFFENCVLRSTMSQLKFVISSGAQRSREIFMTNTTPTKGSLHSLDKQGMSRVSRASECSVEMTRKVLDVTVYYGFVYLYVLLQPHDTYVSSQFVLSYPSGCRRRVASSSVQRYALLRMSRFGRKAHMVNGLAVVVFIRGDIAVYHLEYPFYRSEMSNPTALSPCNQREIRVSAPS